MKNTFLVLLLLVSAFGYSQQTIYDTIVHDGLQRSFILYVPQAYSPDAPAPLVINFHGYTSNAFAQMNYGDFRAIADTAGFLLAHPQGTLDNSGNTYWNANWGGTVDDIGFTEDLIDSLAANYNVNFDRVYSTGMSNGGFMSYTLACELSHRIAAIASVTGTMNTNQSNDCNPQHPMPIMEIHGTADNVVPYNGNAFMESIPNTLGYWVAFNDCSPDPEINFIPDINPNDGCTAEHYRYPSGTNGVEVEHYKIINGGHTWPGSPFPSGGGNTNQDFDASEKIWEFFAKYDINGSLVINNVADTRSEDFIFYNDYSNRQLFIHWSNQQIKTLRMYSTTGHQVKNLEVQMADSISVSLMDLPRGIYLVQLIDANNRIVNTRKLILD